MPPGYHELAKERADISLHLGDEPAQQMQQLQIQVQLQQHQQHSQQSHQQQNEVKVMYEFFYLILFLNHLITAAIMLH